MVSEEALEKARRNGQKSGKGTQLLSRLLGRVDRPRDRRIDPGELRDLVEGWRKKANNHGASPIGSLERAQVYEKCAHELERLIESRKD